MSPRQDPKTHFGIHPNYPIFEAFTLGIVAQLNSYQQLFLNQALAHGTSENNVLSGKAIFEGAIDFPRLREAVRAVLEAAEWTQLRIDVEAGEWRQGETWNGEFSEAPHTPRLAIDGQLWAVCLHALGGQKAELYVHLHHVLGDAHSFALFWEALHTLYIEGKHAPLAARLEFTQAAPSAPLPDQAALPLHDIGLGPIRRMRYRFGGIGLEKLHAQCRQAGHTPMALMVHVLQRQLRCIEPYLAQPLHVGIALRNRPDAKAKSSFLTAVNFLPLPAHPSADPKDAEAAIRHLFRHQDQPLLHIAAANPGQRAFNVLFSYQKETFATEWGPDLQARVEFLPTPIDENMLGIHLLEYGDGKLKLQLDVRSDLAAMAFWKRFLKHCLADVEQWVNQGNFLETTDYGTARLAPENLPIPDFWQAFDAADPQGIALICGGESMDFDSLRAAVDAACTMLDRSKGILFLPPDRSSASIISVLACWRMGIAVCFAPDDGAPLSVPEDSAYLGVTSGTTSSGRKVFITKPSLCSLMRDWNLRYALADSIHLSLADQRFDVFFGDLLRSVLSGHTLVLATEEERLQPQAILQSIDKHRITHLETTPSMLGTFVTELAERMSLRVLICGSEALTPDFWTTMLRHRPAGCRLFNSYGLTEVSIDSAAAELQLIEDQYIPAGHPLGDQMLEVRRADGELQALGLWGELYIRGACVGIPTGETEGDFGLQGGMRSYRTGDKAMILPRCGLVVAGRMQDDFIKVNGRRIPAHAMQQLLFQHLQIQPARCLEVDGRAVLFVPAMADAEPIRALLRQYLSSYQQPDVIFPLAHWPLNQSGKLDLKAMAAVFRAQAVVQVAWSPDASGREKAVHACLLSIGKPIGGKQEPLLWLGWNSIDLIRLANALAMKGIVIPPTRLLATPTIATILDFQAPETAAQPVEEILADDELADILAILNEGL